MAANNSNLFRIGGITQVGSFRGYVACPIGPKIQPFRSCKAFSVTAGSVSPYSSCPHLPIGSGRQSMFRSEHDAAAFITFTHSGTTLRPMSSPNKIPIFTGALGMQVHNAEQKRQRARAHMIRAACVDARITGQPHLIVDLLQCVHATLVCVPALRRILLPRSTKHFVLVNGTMSC
jgi:hypothetical protein